MKILLSNDDGIDAEGIRILRQYLKAEDHEVYVVAPQKEESGTGHGVTLHEPLRIKEVYKNNEFYGYAVSGKPTDCVKLAIWGIYKDTKFDYLISGINRGENLGTDILYSGTVSAAAEGSLLGLSSIAISVYTDKDKDTYNYDTAAKFLIDYLKEIKKDDFPRDSLLNINVPNIKYSELKGFDYTIQSEKRYEDNFTERIDPQGNKYYWLGGEAVEYGDGIELDFNAVKNKKVSITPIKLNLTDYTFLKRLKGER
ncbi:MAG: 5'/3'-nucleotidase SurE [Fusobacteriota bacterium]